MSIAKAFLVFSTIGLAQILVAHDEGHGPKLTDVGKYGGLVTAVVDRKDAAKGIKADLVYKAEMTRSSSGNVRVYLYDKSMNPMTITQLDQTAEGVVRAMVKGKQTHLKFQLKAAGNHFSGKAPKAPAKPFDYDFHFKEKNRELLCAFDNLD